MKSKGIKPSGKHYYASVTQTQASKRRGYEVTDDEVSDSMVKRVVKKMNAAKPVKFANIGEKQEDNAVYDWESDFFQVNHGFCLFLLNNEKQQGRHATPTPAACL